jgi:hypothetical protein
MPSSLQMTPGRSGHCFVAVAQSSTELGAAARFKAGFDREIGEGLVSCRDIGFLHLRRLQPLLHKQRDSVGFDLVALHLVDRGGRQAELVIPEEFLEALHRVGQETIELRSEDLLGEVAVAVGALELFVKGKDGGAPGEAIRPVKQMGKRVGRGDEFGHRHEGQRLAEPPIGLDRLTGDDGLAPALGSGLAF